MKKTDYKRKIIDYLKKNLSKGYTSDALKYALTSQGYSRAVVDVALVQANKELAKKAPILREKPVIKYEIINEDNKPAVIKKPFWKRLLGI